MAGKKINIKKLLLGTVWALLGTAAVVLLVAAMQKKNAAICTAVQVSISGVSDNFFIDKTDVLKLIHQHAGGAPEGKEINSFNLRKIEADLEKEIWVKDAELFFDNNNVLQASVEEREPVARIFSTGGNTFYIDSTNMMLPLSEKFSARLPVFTGFPSDTRVLVKADSILLNDIKELSLLIEADAFLMGMIEQVDITPQRYFEMIPKIGKQVIVFGNAADAEAKFSKLKLFYKNIMLKAGWERYNVINLQFKNQVVARLRGKEDVVADSLRTLQLMQVMADNAAKMSADSVLMMRQQPESTERQNTDTSLIQQSIEREEEGGGQAESSNAAIDKTAAIPSPVAKPADVNNKPAENTKTTVAAKPAAPVIKPNKPEAPSKAPLQKPNPKPPVKQITKPVPKAVMKKN